MMMEKVTFTTDDGEEDFYIIEETKINNISYLLVARDEMPDSECYILKDTSKQDEEEAVYEFVDDDSELEAIGRVFSELLDDETE